MEVIWMTVRSVAFLALATPDIVEIPLHVSKYHQVQKAVNIKVHPRRAGRPSSTANPCGLRDVGKLSVAIVVVQLVASICSNVKVLITVVVIIAYCDSHSVPGPLQASLLGNVFERAVLLLVIETVPILLCPLLRNCSLGSRIAKRSCVYEENVEKSIVVIIEQRHTGSHRFDQVLLRGMRSYVFEMNSQFGTDLYESRRRVLRRHLCSEELLAQEW